MKDVKTKLKSDRLWAALGFVGLLVVNAMFDLGITENQMTDVLWVTITFIAGKSLRSTTGGTVFGALLEGFAGRGLEAIEAVVPDVEAPKDPEGPSRR